MKKWIAGVFLIIVISVIAVYIFIPAKQSVTSQISINCVQTAAERILLSKGKLSSWWPGKVNSNNVHNYKNFRYRFNRVLLNGINATVTNDNDSLVGMIQIIPTDGITTLLQWSSPVVFSNNPVTRLMQYNNLVEYKKNLDGLFADIKNHLEKQENIYGFRVERKTVTDTVMISLKQTFNHYPNTPEVYAMINSLKQFISLNKAEETSYPMLNVHSEDSTSFDVMVAVPTKTAVKATCQFLLKKMIAGNILVAEIKGGIYTVKEAERQMVNYANDYKKMSPAIPYQSLITNRQLQPDTTKWVTRLYYPIFI